MPRLHEHDVREKATALNSGSNLLRKPEELGDKANVFAMVTFWSPTLQCHRVVIHLPEGETLPNLNKLVSIEPAVATDLCIERLLIFYLQLDGQ